MSSTDKQRQDGKMRETKMKAARMRESKKTMARVEDEDGRGRDARVRDDGEQ